MIQPIDANEFTTRKLVPEDVPPVAPRGTGPLDYLIPWVIKLRVVGTASIMQTQVRKSMLLGRSDNKSHTIPDIDLHPFNAYQMGVSRQHAVIAARNSRITIRDLDSANGTFVNDVRIESGKEYRLRHGDLIRLGQLEIQLMFVVMPSSYEKNNTPYDDVVIPPIGNQKLMLLVDDDEKVASTIAYVLKQADFKVIMAHSVSEALTQIEESQPDLVLTELLLPDMSGLEVVQYVKNADSEIPAIVVTGATGGYQMGQAIDAGVDIFLTKPVGMDELLRGLGKIVEEIDK